VLPAQFRLTRGDDLRRVSRAGLRSGGDNLVVHLVVQDADVSPRIGFVVSRAVGGSVVRHRVQRRLRHLCRERLTRLPAGTELVVRALAPSAGATYQELGADLDRCLERVLAGRRADRHGDHIPGQGTVS
jgi:ribonuclease P protein component